MKYSYPSDNNNLFDKLLLQDELNKNHVKTRGELEELKLKRENAGFIQNELLEIILNRLDESDKQSTIDRRNSWIQFGISVFFAIVAAIAAIVGILI